MQFIYLNQFKIPNIYQEKKYLQIYIIELILRKKNIK